MLSSKSVELLWTFLIFFVCLIAVKFTPGFVVSYMYILVIYHYSSVTFIEVKVIEVQSFDISNQLNLQTAFITLVFTADWLPVITYPAPPQMVVKVF